MHRGPETKDKATRVTTEQRVKLGVHTVKKVGLRLSRRYRSREKECVDGESAREDRAAAYAGGLERRRPEAQREGHGQMANVMRCVGRSATGWVIYLPLSAF
ncbi:unnamed protein product [Enterobius vermicularis]|uniref:HTH_Tnp_Tc3_1 domain-containing protein n=1 Tax=Enterobius vermicularis TaxID=51028 RepID=A0A0N4VR18_ENTVE|nr:unnamed protein product [Enterobius vermicularis]